MVLRVEWKSSRTLTTQTAQENNVTRPLETPSAQIVPRYDVEARGSWALSHSRVVFQPVHSKNSHVYSLGTRLEGMIRD